MFVHPSSHQRTAFTLLKVNVQHKTTSSSLSNMSSSQLECASATAFSREQGMLNFICYGLNDKLKQAWLQVRIL